MADDKLAVETLLVQPEEGLLAGRTLRIRYPSVALWIAIERGELTEMALYEEVLDAVEEHDLGRPLARLPVKYIAEIGSAWLTALKEQALPPVTGNDSEKPSRSRRSSRVSP